MEWTDIPINESEKRADKLLDLLPDERKALAKYVQENRDTIIFQASCNLLCEHCFPAKVIECWFVNKDGNYL